jgi:hypothetical protein
MESIIVVVWDELVIVVDLSGTIRGFGAAGSGAPADG